MEWLRFVQSSGCISSVIYKNKRFNIALFTGHTSVSSQGTAFTANYVYRSMAWLRFVQSSGCIRSVIYKNKRFYLALFTGHTSVSSQGTAFTTI